MNMTALVRGFCGVVLILGTVLLSGPAPAIEQTAQQSPGRSAERLMLQGREAFQQGAFEQAVLHWTEALELYQHSNVSDRQGEALIGLVEAYQALGQYDHAVQSLERARQLVKVRREHAIETRGR